MGLMKMMKNWLKKIKGQQGTTLVELLVALSIIGMIVPGLFAAFHAFIHVPAKESATLSSISSVSHASNWVSKDASVAQSVTRSADPDGYVTFTYIDENDQEHQIDYTWDSNEESIIRQDTVGGSSTTLTVAAGIEEYNRADLNVVTFQTGTGAPVDMLVGNLLATHYAGADPREKEASPYTVIRHSSQEAVVGKVFSLLYMGAGNLNVNGWTLYYRDLHVNGNINFSGGTNTIYGNTSAGGDISFSGNTNTVMNGDIRANDLFTVTGVAGGGVNGDISAGEMSFSNATFPVTGSLYANENIDLKNNKVIGEENPPGSHIPGDVKSLGTITIGTGNTIHGQLIQKEGSISVPPGNTVYGPDGIAGTADDTFIDSTLEALDPLPNYPSPITTTIDKLIAEAGTVFYFSGDVTLTAPSVTKDDYNRTIWDTKNEVLNDGVFYAPYGKITMNIDKDGDPISGNVTFIAQQIDLEQHSQWAKDDWNKPQNTQYSGDPSYTLSAYTKGILFWATDTGNAVKMSGLNGVSLQGIVYAPDGDIVLLGKQPASQFILSTGSSIAGDEITLKGGMGSGGVLKFTSIELEPTEGIAGVTEITVDGLGFRSSVPGFSNLVKVYFDDGPWVDTALTDSVGMFSAIFTVPGGAAVGFHTVKAVDGDGNWAAAFFKVNAP